MQNIETIRSYLQQNSKNKIVFCKNASDFNSTDIGFKLSEAILPFISQNNISFLAEDALHNIISSNIQHNTLLGDFVVLTNIGILFEPDLHLNLGSFIERISKEQLLILITEGCIHQEQFFFQSNPNYSIDLAGLSYLNLLK